MRDGAVAPLPTGCWLRKLVSPGLAQGHFAQADARRKVPLRARGNLRLQPV
jgi:hypothetical protein